MSEDLDGGTDVGFEVLVLVALGTLKLVWCCNWLESVCGGAGTRLDSELVGI